MPELPEYDIEGTDEMGSVLPVGEYIARITDASVKVVKSGQFQHLNLSWQIMDGEYAGRVFFDHISMALPSVPWENLTDGEKNSVKIGNSARKSMEMAVLGRCGVRDTDELIDGMAVLKLRIVTSKDGQYPDQNAVSKYMPYQQQQAPQQQAAPAQQQHVAPAAPTTAAPTKPHPFAKRVFAKQP